MQKATCRHGYMHASHALTDLAWVWSCFQATAQLPIACSTENQGEPGPQSQVSESDIGIERNGLVVHEHTRARNSRRGETVSI